MMNSLTILTLKRAGLIIMLIHYLFWGCSKDSLHQAEMFYGYFPTTPGHFVIYEVDSVVYDDFTGQILTYKYQVKEHIESSFIDGEGTQSLRLERFIRLTPAAPWEIKDIWQARRLPMRAEKTEENITFIKLVFPPHQGRGWNGNAYNTLAAQNYRITEAHKPFQIAPSLSFDSTLTVLQREFITLISEDYQLERYAKNIGMIFRRYRSVSKRLNGTITGGVDYTYRIISHGKK